MARTDIEVLLSVLGNPGTYSRILFPLLCLNYIPVAFNHLVMSIYGATPPHVCSVPAGVTVNNDSIPMKDGRLDSCTVYANYTYTSGQVVKCTTWQYALTGKESTIVNEWDLVCDKRYQSNLATSLYFAGVMVGGLVCGHIADWSGPRSVMIFTLFTSVLLGVMVYLVESFIPFMLIRFIIGFLMQGLQICVFVLAVELCATSKNRALTAAVFESHWAVGVMLLAGISYLCQDWRTIQLTISLIVLLSATFIWFIPESLRWLISHQRFKESLTYMKKAAKINKVVISPQTEKMLRDLCYQDDTEIINNKYTLWHAFKTPNLRKHALVMFYVWLATSLGYYGLSLQASKFTGNKYLNFFINGAVELPAYVLGIWIIGHVGRRLPLCFYFLIGGMACIMAGTIPKQTGAGHDIAWVSTTLAWIGKFSTAGCWSVLFLYAAEIFPTPIRNAGTGACAVWARVGSFLSPQINLIAKYSYDWIPFVIFGSVSLLGSLLTLLILPETKTESMPETFEEAEKIGNRHRKIRGIHGQTQNDGANITDETKL